MAAANFFAAAQWHNTSSAFGNNIGKNIRCIIGSMTILIKSPTVLQGATTIWERWNSYTLVNGFGPVDMNSFNHYSYGAIEEWMIAYTLGIQRDEEQPAYKHIILQPRIGGTFSFIRGHYDSAYGRIESGWQIQKKGYIYEATIPANTTATLYLPAKSEKSVRMEKGQEGITPVGLKDGKAVYRLGSGSYRIYVD